MQGLFGRRGVEGNILTYLHMEMGNSIIIFFNQDLRSPFKGLIHFIESW